MQPFRWFYSLFLALLLVGCAPSISKHQAEAIARDSSQLLRHAEGDIPASDWPESVTAIKPLRVTRDTNGVYIETFKFFVDVQGLFILDPSSSFKPTNDADPTYEPLGAGVYYWHAAG